MEWARAGYVMAHFFHIIRCFFWYRSRFFKKIKQHGRSAKKISMAGLCQNHSRAREECMGEVGGWVDGEMAGYVAAPFFHKSYTEIFFFAVVVILQVLKIFLFFYIYRGQEATIAWQKTGRVRRRAGQHARTAHAPRAPVGSFVFFVLIFFCHSVLHTEPAPARSCASRRGAETGQFYCLVLQNDGDTGFCMPGRLQWGRAARRSNY